MNCSTHNNITYCEVNGVFMVGTNVSGLNPNAADISYSGIVEIPEKIDDKAIEAIGAAAFSRCGKITHVYIKAKIKIIYQRAFADCTSLSYINIPSTVEELKTEAIRCYNVSAYSIGSIISKGILVVVFEPNSMIKNIGDCNFADKVNIALHFAEPVYPKLGTSILKNCPHPVIICPKFFIFKGIRSCPNSCTKCKQYYNNISTASAIMIISLIYS